MNKLNTIASSLPATVPFVGPEALERLFGQPFKFRLGANESLFGMSPLAKDAVMAELERAGFYGDPESHDLRSAIAERSGLKMDQIVVGGGIDELLGVAVRGLMAPGEKVITSRGAYPTFNYHVAGFGGKLIEVDYKDYRQDLDGLLNAAHEHKPRLVYLANPDNPTGSVWHRSDLVDFAQKLPEQTIFLLDEAYIEFAQEDVLPKADELGTRTIRFRTFSKAYGMAGMRIGYVTGEAELVSVFHRIRNHFGVNRLAQAAALASINDDAFLTRTKAQIRQGREFLTQMAEDCGLQALPSHTNFMAIDLQSRERADTLLKELQALQVFVRKPQVDALASLIRVSLAPVSYLEEFRPVFETALGKSHLVKT